MVASPKVAESPDETSERRLAAIMFTDMIGYTALGQKNESLSLALVEEQRNLIRPILKEHNGKEVKTIGDAFLIEFRSALDAVRCAYDIQRAIRELNLSFSEEHRLHLRIGIHLGDVVESDGDISGDAVNVASRIEPLAEDGGVCLSRQVYDHVQNKFELPLSSSGLKTLKNVGTPIEVFSVTMPWEKSQTENIWSTSRIAVLPFGNISPDPNDEYFADGLTEELIDRLCQVNELKVIARTSVMNYKKKEKNVSEIAKELKVGSIVEGSVRKAGNKIRVTAQLIDSNTEAHLWSSRYDRSLDDIFVVQTDIAENVVNALKVKLLVPEKKAIQRKGPSNPDAYVEFLRGMYFFRKEGAATNLQNAIKHFGNAIQIQPNYSEAIALLGISNISLGYFGHDRTNEPYVKAKQLISTALELDATIPETHFAKGTASFFIEGNWEKAEQEFKRALELSPNYLEAHISYAIFLVSLGRF